MKKILKCRTSNISITIIIDAALRAVYVYKGASFNSNKPMPLKRQADLDLTILVEIMLVLVGNSTVFVQILLDKRVRG